jgi:hypothetical protein
MRTGAYRPAPNDWNGVFIRGDEALFYAEILRKICSGKLKGEASRIVLGDIADILDSCWEAA